jgi:hypothetical protein
LAGKEDYPEKRVSPLDTGQPEKKIKFKKRLKSINRLCAGDKFQFYSK